MRTLAAVTVGKPGNLSVMVISMLSDYKPAEPFFRSEFSIMYGKDQLAGLLDFYHELGAAINEALPGTIYPLPEAAEVTE